MPVFEYKGLSQAGKAASGIVDAENPKAARQRLRKQGVFATEVREQTERTAPRPSAAGSARGAARERVEAAPRRRLSLSMDVDVGRYLERITVQDVATVTRQLATLFGAGIPIVDSLAALVDQVDNEKLKVVLSDVKERVNEGASLAEAMRGHKKVFSDLYVNMVAAGEQSGALDIVLNKLADYAENQVKLRGKLLQALTYPLLMAAIGVLIIIVLMGVVIPKFKVMFENMHATLPLMTRVLIWVSEFVQAWWALVLGAAVATVWGLLRWFRTERGRRFRDRNLLRMPVFGRLIRMVAVSRFASTLATLLASGVPILNAMTIVRNVVENVIIADVVEQARSNIQEGQSIAVPLKRSGEFPPLVTHMIAIGERTGELENMLQRVARSYEEQVENMVSTLTSLLEPIMIVFMGCIVGIIAAAILLPMLQINQLIHR